MSEWICHFCGTIRSTNSKFHIDKKLNESGSKARMSQACHCEGNEWNVRKVNDLIESTDLNMSINIRGELNDE